MRVIVCVCLGGGGLEGGGKYPCNSEQKIRCTVQKEQDRISLKPPLPNHGDILLSNGESTNFASDAVYADFMVIHERTVYSVTQTAY